MRPFVAIIGGRNSGKSTIIKSLTGCPSGRFRGAVRDKVTGATIEVIASSPQEQALSLGALRAILRRAAADRRCNGVVCALQPSRPRIRLSLEDVLLEALAHRFAIHAFVLDPEHTGHSGRMATMQKRLPPAGRPPRRLDARRFAHQSAVAINARTQIVG
jgi:hypothetical protein